MTTQDFLIAMGNISAFPIKDESAGLSKREVFAMAAMQGLLANDWKGYKHLDPECELLSRVAVSYADALIAALNKD